jgi:hypothetical protein
MFVRDNHVGFRQIKKAAIRDSVSNSGPTILFAPSGNITYYARTRYSFCVIKIVTKMFLRCQYPFATASDTDNSPMAGKSISGTSGEAGGESRQRRDARRTSVRLVLVCYVFRGNSMSEYPVCPYLICDYNGDKDQGNDSHDLERINT